MGRPSAKGFSNGDNEFWKEHVLAAEGVGSTNKAYCATQNLDHRSFSYHKRLLGFGTARKRKRAFIEVRANSQEKAPVTHMAKVPKLPDARWLAELIFELSQVAL